MILKSGEIILLQTMKNENLEITIDLPHVKHPQLSTHNLHS